MPIRRVLRKNRKDRIGGVFSRAQKLVVTITDVSADVSNGTAVITFSQAISSLGTWTAAALTWLNNGVARVDSAWSLTASNQVTVTIAGLAIGELQAIPGTAPDLILFSNRGVLSSNAAGGGVVA